MHGGKNSVTLSRARIHTHVYTAATCRFPPCTTVYFLILELTGQELKFWTVTSSVCRNLLVNAFYHVQGPGEEILHFPGTKGIKMRIWCKLYFLGELLITGMITFLSSEIQVSWTKPSYFAYAKEKTILYLSNKTPQWVTPSECHPVTPTHLSRSPLLWFQL